MATKLVEILENGLLTGLKDQTGIDLRWLATGEKPSKPLNLGSFLKMINDEAIEMTPALVALINAWDDANKKEIETVWAPLLHKLEDPEPVLTGDAITLYCTPQNDNWGGFLTTPIDWETTFSGTWKTQCLSDTDYASHRIEGLGALPKTPILSGSSFWLQSTDGDPVYRCLYSSRKGWAYYDEMSGNPKQIWKVKKVGGSDGDPIRRGDFVQIFNHQYPKAQLRCWTKLMRNWLACDKGDDCKFQVVDNTHSS